MARGLVAAIVALGLVTCGDVVASPRAEGVTAPSAEDLLIAEQEAERLRAAREAEGQLPPQRDGRATAKSGGEDGAAGP